VTPEEPDPLEPLLDAAGRAAQPADPAWDRLADRLARTPQAPPGRRLLWVFAPLVAAAAAAAALVLWLASPPPQAVAGPIEVRRLDVELTVLSASETDGETLYMPLVGLFAGRLSGAPSWAALPRPTGQALVKDHRLILNLQKGDNVVRFTDVAATIDPTSVRFVSSTDPEGTQVVEQNFEYDLASAGALLNRFLDREITCVGRDGSETTGHLAAHDDDSIVLAAAPPEDGRAPRQTQTLARRAVQAIRLNEVPAGLLVKPTLVWKLRARTPGQHDTTVSYLCGSLKWQADYVAVVTPGDANTPDLLDLTGWVSLDNTCGATFEKAGLKLIAGDVNRVRDPWARQALEEGVKWAEALKVHGDMDPDGVPLRRKEFVEKSFFDYHLYTLTAPSTVRDNQTKQLTLLKRDGVKAQRRYVYDSRADGRRLAIELLAKNAKDNNLGLPLPKGRVTFEQRDVDGEAAFLGQSEIDHTPADEELSLKYGFTFDIVGEVRQTGPNAYEIRVRNHKAEEVQVRAVARVGAEQRINQATHGFTMHDVGTAHFDFALKGNSEQIIRYSVEEK
jgi:hypothetical protein